jgi:hypothetical protein
MTQDTTLPLDTPARVRAAGILTAYAEISTPLDSLTSEKRKAMYDELWEALSVHADERMSSPIWKAAKLVWNDLFMSLAAE